MVGQHKRDGSLNVSLSFSDVHILLIPETDTFCRSWKVESKILQFSTYLKI